MATVDPNVPVDVCHEPPLSTCPHPRGVRDAEQKERQRRKPRIHRNAIRLTIPRSDCDIVFANAHLIPETMPNPVNRTVLDNCRRCGKPAELEGPDSLCGACETDATADVLEQLQGEKEVQEAIAATTVTRPLFAAYSPTCVTGDRSRGEGGRFS